MFQNVYELINLYPYIERWGFYSQVKILEVLYLTAQKCFWTPQVTHIWHIWVINKLVNGWDNGSPRVRLQAIIWTNNLSSLKHKEGFSLIIQSSKSVCYNIYENAIDGDFTMGRVLSDFRQGVSHDLVVGQISMTQYGVTKGQSVTI